ncbi:MAG TPA: GtrA family protein [Phycisphaerales bacterium]|nr:GtrA family protein [Phycisphaerales bacterium]
MEHTQPNGPSNGLNLKPALAASFARIGRFGVVSGLGLAMDFSISVVLRELGAHPFVANLTGAACAVTFVFFASVRHVFEAQPAQRGRKYAAYMLWQAAAVPAASLVIALLTPLGESLAQTGSEYLHQWGFDQVARIAARPGTGFLLAKCAFTPVTFYANFLFMGWLLTGRVRWR